MTVNIGPTFDVQADFAGGGYATVSSDAGIVGRDYIKTLAKKDLNATLAACPGAGTRIGAVLDAIGTAGLTRALDGDLDPFLATTLAGVSAWQHLQDVAAADRGI